MAVTAGLGSGVAEVARRVVIIICRVVTIIWKEGTNCSGLVINGVLIIRG